MSVIMLKHKNKINTIVQIQYRLIFEMKMISLKMGILYASCSVTYSLYGQQQLTQKETQFATSLALHESDVEFFWHLVS